MTVMRTQPRVAGVCYDPSASLTTHVAARSSRKQRGVWRTTNLNPVLVIPSVVSDVCALFEGSSARRRRTLCCVGCCSDVHIEVAPARREQVRSWRDHFKRACRAGSAGNEIRCVGVGLPSRITQKLESFCNNKRGRYRQTDRGAVAHWPLKPPRPSTIQCNELRDPHLQRG